MAFVPNRCQHPAPNHSSTKAALKMDKTLLRFGQFLLFPLPAFLHRFLSHSCNPTGTCSRLSFINIRRNQTHPEVASYLLSSAHCHSEATTARPRARDLQLVSYCLTMIQPDRAVREMGRDLSSFPDCGHRKDGFE